MTHGGGPTTPASGMSDTTVNARPATRAELYERIRRSGRDDVIVEEMVRLGFWAHGALPKDPPEERAREEQLHKELRALRTEQSRLGNETKLLKALRQQRMKAARDKRQETKEKKLAARRERARRWRERKRNEILYLGERVSGGLSHKESDAAKLSGHGLPVVNDAMELAVAMNVSVGELRFLTFARRVSRVTHYRRFAIPKKTGGLRHISAPMPRLKELQRWVADHVLARVPLHPAAHGFVAGKSIVSGALPHVGRELVVNLDLEDFFPTVTFRRIKGVFRSLGYSEQVSTLFALLCSEPDVDEVELDGERFFVAKGERHLPQGAPSSPALTNVLCRGLDERLARISEELGFVYTRYADDLSFSTTADGATSENVRQLLGRVRATVQRSGFRVHPRKTRVMRKGARREVTGVVVNDKPSVDREARRRWRAALHALKSKGPEHARFGRADGSKGHDVVAALDGYASFVLMVDREQGQRMKAALDDVKRSPAYPRASTPRKGRTEPPRWRRYEDLPEVEELAAVLADKEGATKRAQAEAKAAASDAKAAKGMKRKVLLDADGNEIPPPAPKKKPWWKLW